MPASFHEIRFPVDIAFGATGGPERRNEIVRLTSGREQRNQRFAASRRRYDAGTGVRSLSDLYDIVAFFEARRGSLHGFRFRDPFDMNSRRPGEAPTPFDQVVGVGDGTAAAYPLRKTYGAGDDAWVRPIRKPVGGTVKVAVDGAEALEGTDFAVDAATGVVTFAPGALPGDGAVVTAGFEFDVPVRFDTDALSIGISSFRAGQIPAVPLVEIEP
jgi:uncharacterized protein (TIGR02217 family)